MLDPDRFPAKSFLLVFFDARTEEVGAYQLPMSVVAPFANRLIREALDPAAPLVEPWYTIVPRRDPYTRPAVPDGFTSLTGGRYDPADDPGVGVALDPVARCPSFEVTLLDLERELFRGTYSSDDLFRHAATRLLRHALKRGVSPDRGPFTYALAPSTDRVRTVAADLLPEDAYQAEGVFRLPPRARTEPRIQFTPVPEPPPPEWNPATAGRTETRGGGTAQAGRVRIPARLFAALTRDLPLGTVNEEGGYVLGDVTREPGGPEREDDPAFRWVVEVTDLLMAEDTVGSPMRLLFTGDTWSKVSRRRDRDFAARKLVGWFHTHLFPATDTFGLSGLDQDMHAWYLPRPWQVAILLNLEPTGERTVRCYQRPAGGGELVETPFEVFEPSAGGGA